MKTKKWKDNTAQLVSGNIEAGKHNMWNYFKTLFLRLCFAENQFKKNTNQFIVGWLK